MLRTAVWTRMGRRAAVVLALCALLPVALFALAAGYELAGLRATAARESLYAASRGRALEIAWRLESAAELARALTAGDVGDAAGLRRRLDGARDFETVVLAGPEGYARDGATRLQLAPSQRAALESGATVLLVPEAPERDPAVFLARNVSVSGAAHPAFFRLAADRLWNAAPEDSGEPSFAIIDAEGRVLHGAQLLSADERGMLARQLADSARDFAAGRVLGWHAAGKERRGAVARVPLDGELAAASPWGIVAFAPPGAPLPGAGGTWGALLLALGAALACVLLGTLHLVERWLLPLTAAREALARLRQRRFARPAPCGADEPAELVAAVADCAADLEKHVRALETLAEIDRLLLGSAELEQVLDAILSRAQALTGCHSVAIALRDPDAPGYGRVYLAAGGLTDLPVARVSLDDEMLATLSMETGGLTIARCEDGRHSFLRPLEELGAELFWVWPVVVADRVEAILVVGHDDSPVADAELARSGAEFASRLGVALSNSARDERLYRQAHYDPLTALPNRVLFRERLARELAGAAAGRTRGALLYIDLDHFKRVNDTVGHEAGDQLLTIVAQRLRACVAEDDTVARLGGDEFTVLLRDLPHADAARAVAERIAGALRAPVSIAGRDHYVSASIGVTLFPDDGTTIDELLHNADTAMYRAKDVGRGGATFFSPEMRARQTRSADSSLHRALRRREFALLYQPQFSVADGALAGVEALLRWRTPREGVRHPPEFVAAAEQSGLIVDIGGWVLESACEQLASWREAGLAPPRVALNVSVRQLRQGEFARNVRRALDRHGIPPGQLELEVVEGALADAAAAEELVEVARFGVQLVLDDFGTGHSALSLLRQYPIGAVKIDRSLLETVPRDPAAAVLVETIIAMVHALGKRVVAEGIESIEQLDFVRERGCDLAQGFYLAKPIPAPAMTELLQARTMSGSEAVRGADVRAVG